MQLQKLRKSLETFVTSQVNSVPCCKTKTPCVSQGVLVVQYEFTAIQLNSLLPRIGQ